jgi:hypothetical protein
MHKLGRKSFSLRNERFLAVAGSMLSLAALCLALYLEAVSLAGAFDFSTPVTWGDITSSCGLVRLRHIKPVITDWVALAGMVGVLLRVLVFRRGGSNGMLIAYFTLFMATGGFVGLIAIFFGWFGAPIDGEFFQDGTPTFLAHGIWAMMLLGWMVNRLLAKFEHSGQAGVPDKTS